MDKLVKGGDKDVLLAVPVTEYFWEEMLDILGPSLLVYPSCW